MHWAEKGKKNKPAIRKLGSHIFQVSVPHVVHGKNEEVVVLRNAGLDIGE
jgi:hypothetical protein